MRYLPKNHVETTLRRGASIEYFIGVKFESGVPVVCFLRIDKEKSGEYSITLFEAIDDGDQEFLDVYEFTSFDPDQPYGVTKSFNSIGDAIDFAVSTYKADINKFVNAGVIQDEYRDYKLTEKLNGSG